MRTSKNAKRHKGRSNLPSDKARDGRQGKSSADSPIENGPVISDGQAPEVKASEEPRPPIVQPGYLSLTEERIKLALIEAHGDIFIASQLLGMGVTAIRLNRAIQVSALLQATLAALQETTAQRSGISHKELEEAVKHRVAFYRVAGLDALHDLATMPLNDNSAQNQVKLAAAARLAGPTEGSTGGELAEALRELNSEYHSQAPRIRVVRQTAIEISRDYSPEHDVAPPGSGAEQPPRP